ncbi:MAG: hypothetical protein KKD44_10895 [Proteobacteria bacterium]|nr:hypothetical protein [Pseudomonadota bacterium]
MENLEVNKPVVEEAQKLIAERQLLRRRRTIKFMKPISYDPMNEKYISVSFQAQIMPRKKAVFSVLFETNADNGISFPNTTYLSWVGPNDLKNYDDMTLNTLYASYQEMGIEDCKPGFMRSGMEKALLSKADIGHTHNAKSIVGGTLSESVIPAGIVRDAELDRMVHGTISKLENRIAQLEKTVAALSHILGGVSRKNETILFSNVNVQIVNGKGSTPLANGLGNLIVGYNESRANDSREGSHNIVVGSKNNYSSYGGIVTGFNNEIDGKYASVMGGNNNSASGDYATITGGAKNSAKGKYSSIQGQSDRTKVGEGENPHFNSN